MSSIYDIQNLNEYYKAGLVAVDIRNKLLKIEETSLEVTKLLSNYMDNVDKGYYLDELVDLFCIKSTNIDSNLFYRLFIRGFNKYIRVINLTDDINKHLCISTEILPNEIYNKIMLDSYCNKTKFELNKELLVRYYCKKEASYLMKEEMRKIIAEKINLISQFIEEVKDLILKYCRTFSKVPTYDQLTRDVGADYCIYALLKEYIDILENNNILINGKKGYDHVMIYDIECLPWYQPMDVPAWFKNRY